MERNMEKSSGLRVERKVALITGAGSGIGRAAAIRLAEQGAKVGLMDIKEETLKSAREQIVRSGGEAIALEADISKPQEVAQGIKTLVDKWGALEIVFANAGINGVLRPIEDMELEEWNTTIDTDLTGTFLTVKYAIPHLKKNGGSIIITSSVNGNRIFSSFGMSAYSTAKAGQVAFMKMAALELAQFGIRVNAICPGAITTNIGENTHPTKELQEIRIPIEFPEGDQPLARGPGKPEQVADLVLFLASNESSHVTGTSIFIDGAESLLR